MRASTMRHRVEQCYRRFRPGMALCAVGVLLTGCTSPPDDGPDRPTGDISAMSSAPFTPTEGTGLIPPDASNTSGPGTGGATPPANPSSTPAAATLAWLAGVDTDHGMLLETDAGQRWQSATPGNYAILGDGWYRHFAPNGAMVGCASGGACVGVDAAGFVAVTAGHEDPRLVYGPGGAFQGRYSADGDRLADPGSVPDLRTALAQSGVDVAGLVNDATLGAPFAGGATGDPHVITAGGVRITTQTIGQFIARGGDPAHQIQLEFSPMAHRDDVSVVSAVAIGANDDVVIADTSGSLTVNGRTISADGELRQVPLSDGAAVGRWPTRPDGTDSMAVVWPDGGSVVIASSPALGMSVVAHLPHLDTTVGLFGSGGDGPGTDLHPRGQTATNTPDIITSWRVRGSERLFPPPSEPLPAFPTKTATPDKSAERVANDACSGRGMTNAQDVAACAFDVAITGDTGFVAGHLSLALPAEYDAVPRSFARRWPALRPVSLSRAPSLPAHGRIDAALTAGATRAYRMTLDQDGEVLLVNRTGCAEGQNPPGLDEPAMRLFDDAGHAVSDRFAFCGHEQTPTLSEGTYYLVLANGSQASGASEMHVRVDVSLP